MTHVIRAELQKLMRRPVLVAAGAGAGVFAAVAAAGVFLSAAPDGPPAGRTATLASLAEPGGGTEAFALGVSFAGLLVLVTFLTNFTGEISRGTLRTLLLREPRRLRLLAGKMTALLAFAALVLAAAVALTWVASLAIAPSQGVPTSEWVTPGALADNLADYGTALLTLGGWAFFGMALAVVLRSTAIALAVGVAWAGPLEHLTEDAWGAADEWFPGLLLEALAVGGSSTVPFGRAVLLTVVYGAAASALAAQLFRSRDVTA